MCLSVKVCVKKVKKDWPNSKEWKVTFEILSSSFKRCWTRSRSSSVRFRCSSYTSSSGTNWWLLCCNKLLRLDNAVVCTVPRQPLKAFRDENETDETWRLTSLLQIAHLWQMQSLQSEQKTETFSSLWTWHLSPPNTQIFGEYLSRLCSTANHNKPLR